MLKNLQLPVRSDPGAHAVEEFEGFRYSLVFYSAAGFGDALDPDKEYLNSGGMTRPTSESLVYFSGCYEDRWPRRSLREAWQWVVPYCSEARHESSPAIAALCDSGLRSHAEL
jgi:hypothetical protein